MGEGRIDAPVRLFSDVSTRIADPWLRRAFMLAEGGRGLTAPNPIVGCVLVRNGDVVGEGFHERAGGPHAEVRALATAGEAARGATAYVTLEPCNHHGRTSPCTGALIGAGVARVVIGMLDPNESVDGGGTQTLLEAGVEVVMAEDATPFQLQNEAWIASVRTHRPFVRAKVALSLDGRPSLEPGARSAMSGPSGALVTRMLRSRADAVLVGGATVAADDPALTVHDDDGRPEGRQPLRVVVVRDLLPPARVRVFTDGLARTVLLAPTGLASEASGKFPDPVEYVAYDRTAELAAALGTLCEHGVVDLLCEPGPRLLSALYEASLIDELLCVHAGGMAGQKAPDLFLGRPDEDESGPLALFHAMVPLEAGIVGDVAVTVWRPVSGMTRSDTTTTYDGSVSAGLPANGDPVDLASAMPGR